MKILIRPLAEFRDCLSERSLDVPEGQSVGNLLRDLAERNNAFHHALFDDGNRLKGFINIVLNGKHLDKTHEADVLLHDGDEITIFSYIAGG